MNTIIHNLGFLSTYSPTMTTLYKNEREVYPSYLRNIIKPPEVKALNTTHLYQLERIVANKASTARTIFHNRVAQHEKLPRERLRVSVQQLRVRKKSRRPPQNSQRKLRSISYQYHKG